MIGIPKSAPYSLSSVGQVGGFALLGLLAMLGVVSVLGAVLAPNLVTLLNRETTDSEWQDLEAIAEGSELYLRRNLAWPPNLAAHSPEYTPLETTQTTRNSRGYLRYYFIHPDVAGFSNPTGLAQSDLPDARLLLISDLSQDAAPTITNAAEFETWWTTDAGATPDLNIHKHNVVDLFHGVILTAFGPGGSYQIDGVPTDSSGSILSTHDRHHLKGTAVGLDEADVYATPELPFTLTRDVAYEYDIRCQPGGRWRVESAPNCEAFLWLTTGGIVAVSGAPGLDSWSNGELLKFGKPNLAFDPGTTGGTFSSIVDLSLFAAGGVKLNALHYVTTDITVGSANSVNLLVGDLLFSTQDNETMTSLNTLSFNDEDLVVFRPQNPGDYSLGTFIFLLDMGAYITGTGNDLRAISLVENDTVVGDVILRAGTFIYMAKSTGQDQVDLQHFTAADVGVGTTSGTVSLLIDGSEINFDDTKKTIGVELVENTVSIGGTVLSPGSILVTTNYLDPAIGDNNLSVDRQDIFYLTVTTTEMGPSGSTAANATLFLDGSDVGLNTNPENLSGLTLVGTGFQASALTVVNPGFETGDITGWTKTGDLFGTGGVNQWGAVTSAAAMSSPHGGTYFGSARADGPTGGGAHLTGIFQRLDVSAFTTQIDTGFVLASVTGYGHGETGLDRSRLRIAFYDAVAGGTQLGANVDSNEGTQSETWTLLAITEETVPVGTRSIELILLGEKASFGTLTNAGVDDVGARLILPW